MTCGCTLYRSACPPGDRLFACARRADAQIQHVASGVQRVLLWRRALQAWTRYLDHIDGCQEGDYRVRLMGPPWCWLMERRVDGQWVVQWRAYAASAVRGRLTGYWRYALLEGAPFHHGYPDHVSGYYRRRVMPLVYRHDEALPSLASSHRQASETVSSSSSAAEVERNLAVYVSALVAQGLPTEVGQRAQACLRIQRSAVKLLLDAGISPIGLREVRLIDTLIVQTLAQSVRSQPGVWKER